MKTRNRFSFPAATLVAVALVMGLAGVALAADKPAAKPAEVTLSGDVQCAMCILKKADAKGCQDVLVVTDKAVKTEYYLAKNAVSEKFGMTCTAPRKAVATGTVSEKDGKKWLTATKLEAVKG
jgi:hypothetical protein